MSKVKSFLAKYNNQSVMLKAAFWFLICSFLQKGISVITTPIFTRLLSTAEYGQYNAFNSWLSILSEIVTLQLYSGVYMQGLVKFDHDHKVFSSSLQGLTLTLVVVWTGIYLAFHSFWNNLFGLTTVQMLAMLLLMWTTAVYGLWAGEQRVFYKYRSLVIVTLIVSVLKPVVGIVFVIYAEDKVTARILGLALVELVGYTGLFVVQLVRGKKFYSGKYWKYALLFNLPLVPHYLSQHVLNSADRIMIQHYIGSAEAGIYSLAYSVSQVMKLFNTALTQTITPFIYQKIKQNRIKDISKVAYIGLSAIALVNLLLILLAPEVVYVFAPVSYREAIYVIPPIAMSVYFSFAYDFFSKFSLYFEKTKFVMLASLSGAVLNIILNAIFIPAFGYLAAGYTTLVCYMVYTFAHYLGMRKVCKENFSDERPYDDKKLIIITVIFMIAGFLLLLTYSYPVIRYGIVIVSLVVAIIYWKKIKATVGELMSLRKKKESKVD